MTGGRAAGTDSERYHEAGRHEPEHHEYPVVPRPHDQDAPDDRGGCEARRRRVRNLRRARIPIASRNPDIDAICGNKPRMIVLNRIDMADPALTKNGRSTSVRRAMPFCRPTARRKRAFPACPGGAHAAGGKLARYAEKGQVGRPLSAMVVASRTGKSTFINQIAGRKGAAPRTARPRAWITADQAAGTGSLWLGALWHRRRHAIDHPAIYRAAGRPADAPKAIVECRKMRAVSSASRSRSSHSSGGETGIERMQASRTIRSAPGKPIVEFEITSCRGTDSPFSPSQASFGVRRMRSLAAGMRRRPAAAGFRLTGSHG